jgi:hypothetical protein
MRAMRALARACGQPRFDSMSIHTAKQRAQHRADEFAAVDAAYKALPPNQRALVKAEFKKQRVASPALTWTRFLSVALTMLPADAL